MNTLKAAELLRNAADSLQEKADSGDNDPLAMAIYAFLNVEQECVKCLMPRAHSFHTPAEDCVGCKAPHEHHTFTVNP